MDSHEYKEVEPVGVQELEDAEKNSVDSDEDDEWVGERFCHCEPDHLWKHKKASPKPNWHHNDEDTKSQIACPGCRTAFDGTSKDVSDIMQVSNNAPDSWVVSKNHAEV